jgi:asparagine synthase (glutamine-hydrolysing)
VRHAVEESVRLHVKAEAPLGAFLSGGVDSYIVAALMRKHAPATRTFTLATPEEPGIDESPDAAAAALRLACDHRAIEVTASQVREVLPRFAADLDQPSIDGLNTWLVARGAASEVRGALSGLGGDEWFAGYPVTGRMARQQHPAKALLRRLAPVVDLLPFDRLRTAGGSDLVSTWLTAHTVFDGAEARRLAGHARDAGDADFLAALGLPPGVADHESAVGLACVLDVNVYMRSQLLRDADATCMAHSLELRVPYVDVEVARVSRSCGDEFKLRPGGGHDRRYEASGAKRVLIEAFRDLLPDGIGRGTKRGFGLPFERWLAADLAPLVDDTCGPDAVRARGLLDPELVTHAVGASRDGGDGRHARVWALMMLELWSRAALDPLPSAAAQVAAVGGAP